MAHRLSVCLIVKDEADVLPRCLASVRDLADEIIAVDTGSVDDSLSILEAAGVRVIHHPWQNDFADARNQAIAHASGDWILMIDADEAIQPHSAANLKHFLIEAPKAVSYDVQIRNFVSDQEADGECTLTWMVRLFSQHPDHHYEGRIHEQLVGSDPVRLDASTIGIDHWGYTPARVAAKEKVARNARLLAQSEAEHGETAASQLRLANQSSDPRLIFQYATRALQLAASADEHGDLPLFAAHRLFIGLLAIQNFQNVLDQANTLEARWPEFRADPAYLMYLGDAAAGLGQHDRAYAVYQEALMAAAPPRSLQANSVDMLAETLVRKLVTAADKLAGSDSTANLQALLRQLLATFAHSATTETLAVTLAARHPGERSTVANLALKAGALRTAMAVMSPSLTEQQVFANVEQLVRAHVGQPASQLLLTWYRTQFGESATWRHLQVLQHMAADHEDAARAELATLHGTAANDMMVEVALTDYDQQLGRFQQARSHLESLLEGVTRSNWTNWQVEILERLGHLAFIEQRWGDAAAAFQQALDMRPGKIGAIYGLACAAAALGDIAAARAGLEACIAQDPQFTPAREALRDLQALPASQRNGVANP